MIQNNSSKRLAVLVSGAGTNLEAILAAGLEVSLVAADRECRGLDVARAHGVPALLIDRRQFGYRGLESRWDRDGFTSVLTKKLLESRISLVAMAGFMTILAPSIFDRFACRIINTHPALLPGFKGAHAVRDALAAGVAETGCTVHIATPELDAGPVLAQAKVTVRPGDDEAELHERIKTAERKLFPATIAEYLSRLDSI